MPDDLSARAGVIPLAAAGAVFLPTAAAGVITLATTKTMPSMLKHEWHFLQQGLGCRVSLVFTR